MGSPAPPPTSFLSGSIEGPIPIPGSSWEFFRKEKTRNRFSWTEPPKGLTVPGGGEGGGGDPVPPSSLRVPARWLVPTTPSGGNAVPLYSRGAESWRSGSQPGSREPGGCRAGGGSAPGLLGKRGWEGRWGSPSPVSLDGPSAVPGPRGALPGHPQAPGAPDWPQAGPGAGELGRACVGCAAPRPGRLGAWPRAQMLCVSRWRGEKCQLGLDCKHVPFPRLHLCSCCSPHPQPSPARPRQPPPL